MQTDKPLITTPTRFAQKNQTWLVVLLLTAVAVLAIGSTSARAATHEVASSTDSGSFANAYATASVDRASALSFEIAGSPAAVMEVKASVSCYQDNKNVGQDLVIAPQAGPITGTFPLTVPRPDFCSISASASFQDYEQIGTISIRLFADQRPNWIPCGKPSYAKRGKLEAHETGCGVARSVTTAAVNKPEREGHYLTVRRWSCSRSKISVRCTKDDATLLFRGKLK
jgi:hypothetical protein